jgi:hypothetical protein
MKTTDPELEYQFPRYSLAEGAFWNIYKVTRFSDATVFCIKQSLPIHDEREKIIYHNELKILRSLDHPNVIRCFESFSCS